MVYILQLIFHTSVCSFNTYACKTFSIQIFQYTIRQIPPRVCTLVLFIIIVIRPKKHFKNEQRSKDAAAKNRPNTSGVGKINNYYEDIYIPPYNNTD